MTTINPYADEARERWGDTAAYRESTRRTADYTDADWAEQRAHVEAIEADFATAFAAGEPSNGPAAAAIAERHRAHIDRWFYPCSYDMQVLLGEMYVVDERFTRHYDDRADGLAQYVCDAIAANAIRNA